MPQKKQIKNKTKEEIYHSLTADVEAINASPDSDSSSTSTNKKNSSKYKTNKQTTTAVEKQFQEKQTNTKPVSFSQKINNWLENSSSIPVSQKMFLVQNLGIMLKAGLSLADGLKAIKQQTPNKRLKKVLTDIQSRVEKGESFSDSLRNYPKIFSDLFVNMVASGEVSGNLETVLFQLHAQLKRSHELVSKIRGAMIYPVIVVSAMVGIAIAMIVFVMPKFISIFEEINAQLPLPTRVLISLSNFIQNNGFLTALVAIVLIASFIKFIKTNYGHHLMHKIFLKAPILSPIIKKINLARFSRTLSSLIKTDIPIVKSFKITASTMGNVYYREALFVAAEKIKKGSTISTVLCETPEIFPPIVTQMVAVGEQSGSIDDILSEVAEFYEEEVDQVMKNLPSIIEPLLMLILGAGVGFMAVAVLMPMYSMSEVI